MAQRSDMEPVGFLTTSSNLMEAYAGDYIELIREELSCSSTPRASLLVQCFLKILDALRTMLHRETMVAHDERDRLCKCSGHILHHMSEVIELEERIQSALQHQVITSPNSCWLTRMTYKYRLLFHALERGNPFGND